MYLLSSAGSGSQAVPDIFDAAAPFEGFGRPERCGPGIVCPMSGGSATNRLHRQPAMCGPIPHRYPGLSCAITGKIPDFLWKSRCSDARADRPAVTRKKKRLQGGCSDQDALRFRVSPDQPASRSSYMGQRGAHPHRDQQITTFWSEISAKFRAPCSNPCVLDAEREEIDAKGGAGMRANQAILLFA